ncbi:thioester reductase domain-containing protein [Clostridium felsineum]|uniref:thioester reductase domain-containing protein n=1 Tax=Clostridium felsineum TaxID=36839 RepID=UPI00214D8A8C|nr:thioester reductase domain-containing protein [Clostridium felsineum]MCR3759638.1 thioester reductase domain-containing protein [Clostridium felsineum]
MNYYVEKNQENFWNLLTENASTNGNNACFSFYDYSKKERQIIELTRNDLVQKSASVATMLKNNGAKKGDRVLIFSTQTADNILSIIGSILAGTIFTIIPLPENHSKVIRFLSVIESCTPKFILADTIFKDKINTILSELKEDKQYKSLIESLKVIYIDEYETNKSFTPEKLSLDDIVYIQYSSGSTSAPKGVMISYGNIISAINSALSILSKGRIFGWAPFFHNLGLVNLALAPIIKKSICAGIMSPEAFLEKPLRWFECISDFKAEITMAPNSVYESYPKLVPAKKLNNIDLSNLKTLINGSEIVSHSTLEKFANEYKDFGITIDKFLVGYGLSETTCTATCSDHYSEAQRMILDLDEYQNGKLVFANENTKNTIEFIGNGKAINTTTAKIVNPTTLKECSENEFGELWIKGPCIAQGYYKNKKATEETFKAKLEGYDGEFLRTGDLGIIKDGYAYITGRIKELIIINGVNIMPNDITVKLKDSMPELNSSVIVPFSILKDDKEKLVVISEIPNTLINANLGALQNRINSCLLDYFEISAHYIGFVKKGELPRADNGKISILKTANLYKQGKLNLISLGNENTEKKTNKVIHYNTETEKTLGTIISNDFSYKVTRDENLLNLGMDSLQVLQLTTNIENTFDVSIPVAFIFENPTLDKIGEYIDKSLKGEDVSLLEKDKTYLYDEVKLDENIKAKEYETENPPMENVFVTGTTGFVGAYLIYSLINQTKSRIYCHVRAKNKEAGFTRLKENMEHYKLWKDEYREYIVPVIGNLEAPLLGIGEGEYKHLTEIVDTVYHNGALLNFVYPYERLKTTNVLSTVKTIEFSCTGKQKFYNYVSSYSAFDNPSHFGKVVPEDDPLKDCTGYFLPYSETKWVSENIIHVARERGLKASIFRPGEITGDNKNGIWKYGDSVSRTIKAMITTKTYPNIDMKVHMTQVDYIADAIVYISRQGKLYGKAYNLLNNVHIPSRKLGEIINECGYETKPLDYAVWKENLLKSDSEHPLKLLESLFKKAKKNPMENIECRYGEMEPILETSNTDEALKGTGITCPPIDKELISKYLKNFV